MPKIKKDETKSQPTETFEQLIDLTSKLSESARTGGEVIGESLNNLVFSESDSVEKYKESTKVEEKSGPNNVPPFDWSRNSYGLLNHVNYIFNEDGSVNWHAMIPSEHFVPNRQNFERRKQDIPKSIEGLDTKDLLLLLSGFKFISLLRGFSKVDQEIVVSREDYVAVKTTICLLPCYETDYKSVCFSELADAHINNTNGFGKYYLNAMASNRGFVRCWRNALRLPVTAFDEIGEIPKDEDKEKQESSNPASPLGALQRKMNDRNISFEKLQQSCIKKEFENAAGWKSINDIPVDLVAKIIQAINEKESKEKV